MTLYFSEKQEQRCRGGIRRTEVRCYSTVDEVGNVKLKRIVGKSFFQHTNAAAGVYPANNKDAKPA